VVLCERVGLPGIRILLAIYPQKVNHFADRQQRRSVGRSVADSDHGV
jgi:hypothetical protein